MKILVCIKQVPGTNNVAADPVTGVLIRDGVESKLNPYDLFGLEMALQLRERFGGEVRVITMGPPQAERVVAEAVYMGADGGVVVSDRAFAGADVLATSYTLSQALRQMGDFDLIICGKQTTDGDTAQVGAEIGEFLSVPHIGNVLAVEKILNGRITVRVDLDRALVRQTLPLPCLICVNGEINTPRLPSYKRRQRLGKLPLCVLGLHDLGDRDQDHYGLKGSPTQVERLFPPEKNTAKQMLSGSNAEQADQLSALLKARKFV